MFILSDCWKIYKILLDVMNVIIVFFKKVGIWNIMIFEVLFMECKNVIINNVYVFLRIINWLLNYNVICVNYFVNIFKYV